MEADGTFEVLLKKSWNLVKTTADRLEKFLGGIEDILEFQTLMLRCFDPRKNVLQSKKLTKLNIPIVAMVW